MTSDSDKEMQGVREDISNLKKQLNAPNPQLLMFCLVPSIIIAIFAGLGLNGQSLFQGMEEGKLLILLIATIAFAVIDVVLFILGFVLSRFKIITTLHKWLSILFIVADIGLVTFFVIEGGYYKELGNITMNELSNLAGEGKKILSDMGVDWGKVEEGKETLGDIEDLKGALQ